MRRAMETYRKEQQREYQKRPYSSGGAEATYTSEGRKEVQQAVKDLKVFLQTSRLVVRTWNRQIREINKVLRNTKYSERVDNIKIDGEEVFGKTEDAWRRAA